MITDAYTKVSSAQAITSATAIAPLVSTSSIDMLAAKDLGGGKALRMAFQPTTTFAPQHGAAVTVSFTNANDLVGLTAHGLPTGTPVVFDSITTTTGLTEGTIYYVTRTANATADLFCVASSKANAIAGTAVVLGTGDGSGTMTVLATLELQVIGADDAALTSGVTVLGSSGPIEFRHARRVTFDGTTDEEIDLVAHGFHVGTPVVFAGAGTPPAEITLGRTYWTLESATASADHFRVATSLENARAGIAVTPLTGNGTPPYTVQRLDGVLSSTGPTLYVDVNESIELVKSRRYVGARYVPNCTPSAGAFTAQLLADVPLGTKKYPSGYEV